jgi:hypothetical protein
MPQHVKHVFGVRVDGCQFLRFAPTGVNFATTCFGSCNSLVAAFSSLNAWLIVPLILTSAP